MDQSLEGHDAAVIQRSRDLIQQSKELLASSAAVLQSVRGEPIDGQKPIERSELPRQVCLSR
jgi:hypothetical protein